jgi:quinol monooxygenase YgiN
MAEISRKNGLATLILDFRVEPDKIQQLSKIVQQNIENVMSKKDGFVSANIHESSSGTHLVNYSQWKSRESYANAINFLTKEEVLLGEKLLELGEMKWNFYEIISSVGKTPAPISAKNGYPTGINIIDVAPKNSKQLIELLSEYIKNVLQNKSGLVSANIHKSDDGRRVINYVQWESFDGMVSLFRDDAAKGYFIEWKKISDSYWNLFKVVYTT